MKNLLLKATWAAILTVAVLVGTTSQWMEKGIWVSFNQETNSNIDYRVFYTLDEQEKIDGTHTVHYQAQATESEITIKIPESHITKFRLDPGVKPGKVTIGQLKLTGDSVVELNDFNEFSYSSDVEDKVIEDNRVTIVSNQKDPFMVYANTIELDEGTFVDWGKAILWGALTFLAGFILLGLFSKKK